MKTSYLAPQPGLGSTIAVISTIDEALIDIFGDAPADFINQSFYTEAWLGTDDPFEAPAKRAIPFLAHLEAVTGRPMIQLIADKKNYHQMFKKCLNGTMPYQMLGLRD